MSSITHGSRHGRVDGGRIPFPEPGVRPHYAPDRVVRITRIDLEIGLEPAAHTFTGRARLGLHALPTYRGSFGLDFDEVVVDTVTDRAGTPLDHALGDGQLTIKADEVPAEVIITWHGADPRRGLYFTGPTDQDPDRQHMAWTQCQDEDGHFVFPCHDHPGVKHPWTIEITAPSGYTLLSNGACIETDERDGRSWARYDQREPMPAYLVTVVAARLTKIDSKWRDRPVRYFVPVGQEEHVQRAFGKTPEMIECFSRVLGVDYPWPRYDQVVVHDFIFGGMENVACTTMTDMLLVDEKGAVEWDPEGLVSHELAHQWFGDLVTCQDWSQGWLNESWATYLEAIWWENTRGAVDAVWYRHQTAQGYHDEASGRYRRPIVSYRFREPIDVFDRHLYNKGSCVLWSLRHELGDDAFWAGVQAYLEAHRHDTVHTRHFQRAMEAATGRNLDAFFEQWIHSAGHPMLEVSLGRESGQVTVTVTQTQTGDDVPEVFALVLRIEVAEAGNPPRSVDLRIDARERTFVIPVLGDEVTVRVDPGYRVLAEISLKGPEAWLQALVADPCPVLAVRAAGGLLAEGRISGRDAVFAALSDHPFHGVRSHLAKAIGGLRTDASRDRLIAALQTESDPRPRRAIVEALGQYRHPDAAAAITALLGEELPTWHLHGGALTALGRTREPGVVAVLMEHLEIDSWGDLVRQRALAGLAETEDAEILPILLSHSREGSDRVRGAAAGALGRLADAVDGSRREAVERLVEMVDEPGFRTQLQAISALGRVRDPASVPALDRLHRTAPDGRTRRMAYEALVRVRAGRTTEAGLAALRRHLDTLSEENARLRDRVDRLER